MPDQSAPTVAGDALPVTWFTRHPLQVAFDLIGCWFEVERDGGRVRVRIVETEAYGGAEDAASHASIYRIGATHLSMPPGSLYMQRSYGLHTMTNIVAHLPGALGAVLIRAADDPVEGFGLAQARRGVPDRLLTGPGNFSRAVGTTLGDLGSLVTGSSPIRVLSGTPPATILKGPRIGITRAVDVHWRFWDGESRSVSRTRRGLPVTRSMIAELANHFTHTDLPGTRES
jgi:DNA-3-methyladenine glycosylase